VSASLQAGATAAGSPLRQEPLGPQGLGQQPLGPPGVVDRWARGELAHLGASALLRRLERLDSAQGPTVQLDGQRVLNFSSNDYLGLASDPTLAEAGRRALTEWGTGAGASRLVVGHLAPHASLERALARFENCPATLVFSSGYAANLGALSALVGEGDAVFSDALNHASVIDGCRLSRAQVLRYRHCDVGDLRALLRQTKARRRLVVTDSVFSMDGDLAPLVDLKALCREEGAGLMVDEAHGTGVFGPTGAGLCEAVGVEPDVRVGTLSKALGGAGAWVAGSSAVVELVLNRARSFVFSTGLPPAVCAAGEAAVLKVASEPELRARLWRNVEQLAAGLGLPATSPIFSIVLGAPVVALEASRALLAQGLLVKAIRPPTVPEGTSRLRVSLSAAHTAADIEHLVAAVRSVL
jgi:8-amino-7-oxononanoate synthase